VERAVLLTGIGGQGVQLAAQVLALAALDEGRDVQLFGSYGGMMRGGNTDATVVLSDDRVTSPPTVGAAWAALVLHHEYAATTLSRIRPGGVVVRNTSVWEGAFDATGRTVVDVAATELAQQAGNAIAAAMVMLGALSSATGMASLAALQAAARQAVPAYRTQHVELNARALDVGAGAVASVMADAWPERAAARSGP
jgi:Pyruvate/2-oxoacid:ferredoxin oxidoreductase gamma subunit